MNQGIFIDQCFDVGCVEDVHLWPFWDGWEGDLGKFTREQGIACIIGRTIGNTCSTAPASASALTSRS